MNEIIQGSPILGASKFAFAPPAWLNAAYRAGFGVLAVGFGVIASAAALGGGAINQFFWLAAIVSTLCAISPRPIRNQPEFFADHRGLYFPERSGWRELQRGAEHDWLHIPWNNIRSIRCELMPDESATQRGIVMTLLATTEERQRFLATQSVWIAPESDPRNTPRLLSVGYASMVHSPEEVLQVLTQLRAVSRPTPGLLGTASPSDQGHFR